MVAKAGFVKGATVSVLLLALIGTGASGLATVFTAQKQTASAPSPTRTAYSAEENYTLTAGGVFLLAQRQGLADALEPTTVVYGSFSPLGGKLYLLTPEEAATDEAKKYLEPLKAASSSSVPSATPPLGKEVSIPTVGNIGAFDYATVEGTLQEVKLTYAPTGSASTEEPTVITMNEAGIRKAQATYPELF